MRGGRQWCTCTSGIIDTRRVGQARTRIIAEAWERLARSLILIQLFWRRGTWNRHGITVIRLGLARRFVAGQEHESFSSPFDKKEQHEYSFNSTTDSYSCNWASYIYDSLYIELRLRNDFMEMRSIALQLDLFTLSRSLGISNASFTLEILEDSLSIGRHHD